MKKIFGWIFMFILLNGCSVQNASQPRNTDSNAAQVNSPSAANQELPVQNTDWTNIPLENSSSRVTKKPFGIKVSPQNSPVQPERFSGYHTGVDYEITSEELNQDVQVAAICSGKILQKRTASGYGGILVQSCQIRNKEVTVVYGHLRLTSINQKDGDELMVGEKFALLGKAFSTETGSERKHLHLGIHLGTQIDIKGYVQNADELKNWINFEEIRKDLK